VIEALLDFCRFHLEAVNKLLWQSSNFCEESFSLDFISFVYFVIVQYSTVFEVM